MAPRLDEAVKQARPDGWPGVVPKENKLKQALYEVLKDIDAVERSLADEHSVSKRSYDEQGQRTAPDKPAGQ